MGNCIPIVEELKQTITTYLFPIPIVIDKEYTEEFSTVVKAQSINVYHDSTAENTPVYTYEHLRSLVKVLTILDGDTVDIALHHEETGKIFKHRVRLYGIDTPEKRPSLSNPDRDKEIAASKKSSEALCQKLKENDNMVVALFYQPDKYGRLLCTFYDKGGDDINKWMVQSGFAYEYFGKTKKAFSKVSPKTLVSECDNDYFENHETVEKESSDDFEDITEMKEMKS